MILIEAIRAGAYGTLVALAAALGCAGGASTVLAQSVSAAVEGGSGNSGLAVPRFVSLKADRVNLRTGPGTEYPTSWVFRRAGMPVEVIKEFESWRQVRDADGATGWVLSVMLSGRRTALVLPWELKQGKATPEVLLKANDRESAQTIATIEAGVIANIRSCDKSWCAVAVGDYRGYIEQKKLWGVYPDESIR